MLTLKERHWKRDLWLLQVLSGGKNQFFSQQIHFQTLSSWKKNMAPLNALHPKTPLQSASGGRLGGNQVLSPPLMPNTHQVQNPSLAPSKIHFCCHQVYLANQVYNMHQVSPGCQLCPYNCFPARPSILLERTKKIQCRDLDKNQHWKKATSKLIKKFPVFKFEWKFWSLTCKEGIIEFLTAL